MMRRVFGWRQAGWTILCIVGIVVMVACGQRTTVPIPTIPVVPIPVVPPAFPISTEAGRWQRTIIGDARFYFGLEVDYSVFFAQIHQESRWKADATSRAGAQGIAQFMPATAAGMQRNSSVLRELCREASGCPYEPRWAVKAMIAMDRDLWKQYPFAAVLDERWAFSLVSYNAGAGWIRRERARCLDDHAGCDRWFGEVERFCLRAEWACKESRGYAPAILHKWRPGYRLWLDRS